MACVPFAKFPFIVKTIMHLLWWREREVIRGVLNVYLHPGSARIRRSQLREAATWLNNFRHQHENASSDGSRVEFIFGGDRNFVSEQSHRVSQPDDGRWHPCRLTLQAWEDFESALGQAAVAPQTDFT